MRKNNFREYLLEISKKFPNQLIENLILGSKIQKSWGLYYEIDNPDIDKKLGVFPNGAVPYGPIYRHLKDSKKEIMEMFNQTSKIPFSKVYNKRIGECVEKSILVQLGIQRGEGGFIVNGCLEIAGEIGASPHAYNIVFRDKKPFLIDVQNPLRVDSIGKVTHPYIAPILDISENYGEFLVPKEWKQERSYCIF